LISTKNAILFLFADSKDACGVVTMGKSSEQFIRKVFFGKTGEHKLSSFAEET